MVCNGKNRCLLRQQSSHIRLRPKQSLQRIVGRLIGGLPFAVPSFEVFEGRQFEGAAPGESLSELSSEELSSEESSPDELSSEEGPFEKLSSDVASDVGLSPLVRRTRGQNGQLSRDPGPLPSRRSISCRNRSRSGSQRRRGRSCEHNGW